MKKKVLETAYLLASDKKYAKIKGFFYDILESHKSSVRKYFDFFMIFLVITTVFILIYETKNELPSWVKDFEIFALTIFIWEWIARLWVISDIHLDIIENYEDNELEQANYTIWQLVKPAIVKKIKFIFSPLSIIDLLAILPSYRPLRVLRFLLIFRLLKVFRYTEDINYLFRVFVEKKYEFFTLFFIFIFLIFFAGTTIYVFEGTGVNGGVNNFFEAMYWAVITITTVGYGDITPVTPEGKFVTGFLVIAGLILISFMTSIVTTSMADRMDFIKSNNVFQKVGKLKNYILICGYGRVAKMLAMELGLGRENIVIIDSDEGAVDMALSKGYYALRADATDIEFLEKLEVGKKATKVVTLVSNDAINLSIILSVKSLNNNIEIYSRAVDETTKDKLIIAGADEVIFPYESAAMMACKYINKPVAIDAISRVVKEYEEPIMDEIEIYEDFGIVGNTLGKIGLLKNSLKLIGVVSGGDKEKFIFNPKKDEFIIKSGDILMVLGKSDNIYRFKLDLQKRS